MKHILTTALFLFSFVSIAISQEDVTINGYIKDANNGETLIGATCFIKELNIPAFSNRFNSNRIEFVDSPNSPSKPLRYAVILLLRKNFNNNLILVLDDINASIIIE